MVAWESFEAEKFSSGEMTPNPPRFTFLRNARTHGVFACRWIGNVSLLHSLAQGSIKVKLGSTNAQDWTLYPMDSHACFP